MVGRNVAGGYLVKKIKWLVISIVMILMLSGVAYAGWAEQTQIVFNTRTASTRLSFLRVEKDRLNVSVTGNQATISATKIKKGTNQTADITYINSGCIPLNIDNIKISNVSGYNNTNKNKLYIDISVYISGNLIFNDTGTVDYWKSRTHVNRVNSSSEVSVGGTIIEQITVRYTGNSNENVTFILTPEYSRFNEG